MATLIFEISWSPLIAAQLTSLLDNGIEQLAAPGEEGAGRITVSFESDPLVPHTIIWDLFSVGNKLTGLKAVAAWEHGIVQPLDDADAATNRWQGHAIVRRKKVAP